MRLFKVLGVAATAFCVSVSASNAASVTDADSFGGLNSSFVTNPALEGSWFYNFNGRISNGYTDRHLPISGENLVFESDKDIKGNRFDYGEAVRRDGSSAAGLGLSVVGGVDYTDGTITTGNRIIEDVWNSSSRKHHGIGLYYDTESANEEQVNAGSTFNQFLVLDFNQEVSLSGFDFAGGNHYACGRSDNQCGGWELYSLSTDVDLAVALAAAFGGAADRDGSFDADNSTDDDFAVFDALNGSLFAIRAALLEPPVGQGEMGWYLSGVAGATAVPVPAALPLMLAGLAALGMAARRRKRAVA